MDMDLRKKELRREIREAAEALDKEYCRMADQAILRWAAALPEYETAGTVFCFVGTSDEIDTVPMLQDALARGKKIGVPRCVARGIMEVCCLSSLDDLEKGSYGIMEPKEGTLLMRPEELELAIVPCLSCSSDGKRLGHGGGYYDRYLEQTGAFRAVLCRGRSIREDIPMDVHDKRMDAVISEDGIKRM